MPNRIKKKILPKETKFSKQQQQQQKETKFLYFPNK